MAAGSGHDLVVGIEPDTFLKQGHCGHGQERTWMDSASAGWTTQEALQRRHGIEQNGVRVPQFEARPIKIGIERIEYGCVKIFIQIFYWRLLET